MALILSGDTGVPASGMPTGSVLQVVNSTTKASVSTSSATFVTTGLSVTITPRATTSKIYVTVQGGGAYMVTTAQNTMYCTIYRNSTNLGDANFGLSRHSTPGGTWQLTPHSMSVLDSPSTTSSITYGVYFYSTNGATVQFSDNDRGVVSMTAMEIQG